MNLSEKVKEYIAKYNLELLSTPMYIMDNEKIRLRCKECGEEFEMQIKNLLYPHPKRKYPTACPLCTSKFKFIDRLKFLYGKNPYTFLSDFKGYSEPLKVRCNTCGYEWVTPKASRLLSNASLKEGHHPCKNCANIEYKKKTKTESISDFEKLLKTKFGECNYTFPNPEEFRYHYQETKMHFICKKCGHEMYTLPTNVLHPKNGKHYCRVCNKKDRLLERMSYADRCKMVTKGKIEPIEDYIDSRTAILHRCNICGYEWKKPPVKNIDRGAGCPKCAKKITVSKAETQVLEFIKTEYSGKIITKDRTVLNGKEIDIYLPDIKLGFEVNGLYYHSTDYKDNHYHLDKQINAYKKGVTLIHIYDSFWYHANDIMKGEIVTNIEMAENVQLDPEDFDRVDIDENKLKELGIIDGLYGTEYYVGNDIVSIMYKNTFGDFSYIQFHNSPDILGIAIEGIKDKTRAIRLDRRYNSQESNICRKVGLTLAEVIEPTPEYFSPNLSADFASLELTESGENTSIVYNCGFLIYTI